mmetsp:Transcript_4963/g.12773  ORF Transcript_4963/g.12773 Transcript_4963/m.12773 type:complete len:130 (+) Transcript_4963:122-511(+)
MVPPIAVAVVVASAVIGGFGWLAAESLGTGIEKAAERHGAGIEKAAELVGAGLERHGAGFRPYELGPWTLLTIAFVAIVIAVVVIVIAAVWHFNVRVYAREHGREHARAAERMHAAVQLNGHRDTRLGD